MEARVTIAEALKRMGYTSGAYQMASPEDRQMVLLLCADMGITFRNSYSPWETKPYVDRHLSDDWSHSLSEDEFSKLQQAILK